MRWRTAPVKPSFAPSFAKELAGVLDLERLLAKVTIAAPALAICWRSASRSSSSRN